MKFLLAFVAICACSTLSLAADEKSEEFAIFKLKHKRVYKNPVEAQKREKAFLQNIDEVEKHNQLFMLGLSTFRVELNDYGDFSHGEFLKLRTGYVQPKRDGNNSIAGNSNDCSPTVQTYRPKVTASATQDWRTSGSVSPVKDQGDCGSCWAFAATGALESHTFIKTKRMVSLSEQNLVDCTKGQRYQNAGCDGGSETEAYLYVRDNLGIDTGVSYPYEGVDTSVCRFKNANVGATDKGFVSLTQGDETKMKTVVSTIGPISVAIYASSLFMKYRSGVYNERNCPTDVNHAVLVVGYGTENGLDYWLIKNSWGTSWGDNGYIKFARGTNKCGVALWAAYPLL